MFIIFFQSEPFLRLDRDNAEGFIADIVSETSKMNNFSYDIFPSVDNRYGVETESGSWNGEFQLYTIMLSRDFFQGLVGMLMRNEIDLIAADLTVTAARLKVMDFSKPFMSSSITFLLRVSNSLRHWPKIFQQIFPH